MSKLWAAFISALLITTAFTLSSEYERGSENVLYYPFIYKIGVGFLVVFSFYLLIGIPLSMVIDRYIRSSKRWVKILAYSLSGSVVALAFLAINPYSSMSGSLRLLLYFGLAGLIFSLVHTMISRRR